MLTSILIANRGEIACRIIRTAKRLGLRTVAVFSEADAQAMHVRMADQAVPIGGAAARESYLVGEKIIAAARETGAQGIHPGYGFLSENANFAQAVIDAGLVWIGPPPSAISAMGLKDAAKALMQQAGVPTTPGYLGQNQDADFLAQEAARIGYPVLIKAVAGGGGKGMRLVEQAAEFADALASCQREAAASFGNAHVLIEAYIPAPRHIEVQVFGDAHGNVVHLFERDCSLQRRHQKVIEEAPAPGMDEATREAVCQAAVRAAQAVGYQGAGTVEFIADGSQGLRADRVWFMEMNTRLQVEHPVTEAITGVDLVEWQIRVASGEPLPMAQQDLAINGWAMEARLYAEDPAKGFLPSIGRLDRLNFGQAEGGRVDTGVTQGDTITPFYDPMIAKVIAHGPSRDEARRRLSAMLDQTAVWPVRTNAAFLARALAHPQFVAGTMDTGVIGRDGAAMAAAVPPSPAVLTRAAMRLVAPGLAPGLRLNAAPARTAHFLLDGAAVEVMLDGPATGPAPSTLVCEGGQTWRLEPWHHKASGAASAGDGAILAPMPGRVLAVMVTPGEVVAKGQKLLTLEAMKMEHTLLAPFDGVVDVLATQAGAQVQVDALLARITQPKDAA